MAAKKDPIKFWSPATPAIRCDNIISSDARKRGERGFKPAYLKDDSYNMYYLLSNEYNRMWLKERDVYAVKAERVKAAAADAGKLKRKYIRRDFRHPNPMKKIPIIELKQFQNIGPKINTYRKQKTVHKDDEAEKTE